MPICERANIPWKFEKEDLKNVALVMGCYGFVPPVFVLNGIYLKNIENSDWWQAPGEGAYVPMSHDIYGRSGYA